MKGVFHGRRSKKYTIYFCCDKEDSKRPYPLLDFTITDPQERNQKVHEIVNSVSPEKLTPYYLE